MKTWQIEPNALHYTKEKLCCSFCKKQVNKVIQIEEYLICLECFFDQGNFESIFKEKEFILIRMITDVLFDDRKGIKKKERGRLTLKLRYEIFKRDKFKCVLCGVTGKEEKIEIDHIIPISEGGKTIKSNLRTLCFKCNRGKGKDNEN